MIEPPKLSPFGGADEANLLALLSRRNILPGKHPRSFRKKWLRQVIVVTCQPNTRAWSDPWREGVLKEAGDVHHLDLVAERLDERTLLPVVEAVGKRLSTE